jgi:spermidine/putrescine transport system permease protein
VATTKRDEGKAAAVTAAVDKRGRVKGARSTVAEPRALLIPASIWYAVLLVVPLAIMLAYAFARKQGFSTFIFGFNLENWQRVWDPIYRKVFRTTFVLALTGTVGCLLVGYPLAYWLATRVRKHRTLIMLLIIVPFWTSLLVRTYSWVLILSGEGPVSHFLERAGLIGSPLNVLYTTKAVLVGLIYDYLPLMVFPLYVSLDRLDRRLLEASRDLGAGRLATFRGVTLPLTMPGIITGSLLVFIPMMGEYVVPSILGGARSFTVGSLVAFQFLTAINWAFGAAVSMALILSMLLVIFLYLRAMGRQVETNLGAAL